MRPILPVNSGQIALTALYSISSLLQHVRNAEESERLCHEIESIVCNAIAKAESIYGEGKNPEVK